MTDDGSGWFDLDHYNPKFEEDFGRLAGEAAMLPDLFWNDFGDGGLTAGNDEPRAAIGNLNLVAEVHFHASLKVLFEDFTTLAAVSLMRPLTETFAHLHNIAAGGKSDGARRAMLVELEMARRFKEFVETVRPLEPDVLESAQRRVDDILGDFAGRGFRADAKPPKPKTVLKAVSVEGSERENYLSLWKTGSSGVHAFGHHWLVTVNPDGVVVPRKPLPSHRAMWFKHLLDVYGDIVHTSLGIVGRTSRSIDLTLQGVRTAASFAAALSGAYDPGPEPPLRAKWVH
jgi:hypothetical protein